MVAWSLKTYSVFKNMGYEKDYSNIICNGSIHSL
jgi:hypothetical protein